MDRSLLEQDGGIRSPADWDASDPCELCGVDTTGVASVSSTLRLREGLDGEAVLPVCEDVKGARKT